MCMSAQKRWVQLHYYSMPYMRRHASRIRTFCTLGHKLHLGTPNHQRAAQSHLFKFTTDETPIITFLNN